VRSGKSRFAERLARDRGGEVVYVATARPDPDDAEWTERIAVHASQRPAEWALVETSGGSGPVDALVSLVAEATPAQTLIVDSLGTWLADVMLRESDPAALDARAEDVVRALVATSAHAIVVGEEIGWGIVPMTPVGRLFRDVLGRAQQRLAAGSAAAYLVVAGFAIDLKTIGRPVGEL